MRTGAYTVHQTLTPEAASVLKQSLTLARKRGHSQLTPLHVASTLLTSTRSNLFRRACLKSHPFTSLGRQIAHPFLHCRALELCFNVSLNRLPTNSNPLFQTQPSLSNALVAALKRAQAHQRRGCVEQQQNQPNQPFLAVKVELEQIIMSILDDPSVSRVMREAGLSSLSVQSSNIEDNSSVASPAFYGTSSSVGVFSSPCSPSSNENNQEGRTLNPNPSKIWHAHLPNHHSFEQNPLCGECAFNYEKEAKAFISHQHKILPPWLQAPGDNNNINQKDELSVLNKKWNRFCQALHHKKPGMTTQNYDPRTEHTSSVAKFRRQNSCTIEFSFGSNHQEGTRKNLKDDLGLNGFKSSNEESLETKITLALGHSPFPSNLENSDEEEPERVIPMALKGTKPSSCLINHKRKPEFEAEPAMIKLKNPRIEEEEDEGNVACNTSNIKKELSRQLSIGSNGLDLNISVDTDEEEAKPATQISNESKERFLDSTKNRFDFTVLY